MDQSALDKRYGEDGKRTNICFPCNKTGHWAKNCLDKEKQTWNFVFVYVDPYSHELKILPTMRLAHQFQNMKYVGILKSFCNKYKINSPQNTISVESQTENMQNDNTSVSDSEICQNSRTNGERNKRKSKYPKIKSSKESSVNPGRKIKSTVIKERSVTQ